MKYKKQMSELTIQKKVIVIMLISIIFAVILWIQGREKQLIVDGELSRPGENQTAEQLDLDVYFDQQKDPFTTQITVNPQSYSLDELEPIFNQIYDKLPEIIVGDNDSLFCVKSKLNLVPSVDDYPIKLDWYSDSSLIDYEGIVYNSGFEKGEIKQTYLTVVMKYDEYTAEYQYTVIVCSPDLNNSENQKLYVISRMEGAEEEDRESSTVQLPTEVEGHSIRYYLHNDTTSPFLALILGIIAVGVIIYGEYKKKSDQTKYRQEQLISDYSELITKLTLLIGAGMTVRRAWGEIVADYQRQISNRAAGNKVTNSKSAGCKNAGGNSGGDKIAESKTTELHYVYEEMLFSLNELNAGMSEETVYERFGRRCGQKEYLKLGALLQQNIRKGSKDLLVLLQNEAVEAFSDRKNRARKKGEEAGTKLLIPMVMMLAVVMVIVMIPAMTSFQF